MVTKADEKKRLKRRFFRVWVAFWVFTALALARRSLGHRCEDMRRVKNHPPKKQAPAGKGMS